MFAAIMAGRLRANPLACLHCIIFHARKINGAESAPGAAASQRGTLEAGYLIRAMRVEGIVILRVSGAGEKPPEAIMMERQSRRAYQSDRDILAVGEIQ